MVYAIESFWYIRYCLSYIAMAGGGLATDPKDPGHPQGFFPNILASAVFKIYGLSVPPGDLKFGWAS